MYRKEEMELQRKKTENDQREAAVCVEEAQANAMKLHSPVRCNVCCGSEFRKLRVEVRSVWIEFYFRRRFEGRYDDTGCLEGESPRTYSLCRKISAADGRLSRYGCRGRTRAIQPQHL